mgnify:CR=1 FL=1
MSEEYRFFDSIDGEDERFYTADEFAEYFRQFIRNGIFNGGENLKVVTDEKDMKVSIKPGYAWIEGYLYKISGEDLILEHGTADPSLNRTDRIVIRLDKTLENRYVKAFILEGTPELTPKVPELTRNDNIYEISLAKIEIIAGKSFIENYQITDERLDNTVCGLTTHLFEQIDTAGIFDEWQNYLIHKRNVSNLSYDEFVATYQSIWNSWVEDKISEPSGEFYAEWKSWFNEVQDTTNLVTKSQFDEFKDTKGVSDGFASLDEEAYIPVEQLENVQYLKDFYGRRAYKKEFNLYDLYGRMNFNILEVSKAEAQTTIGTYNTKIPDFHLQSIDGGMSLYQYPQTHAQGYKLGTGGGVTAGNTRGRTIVSIEEIDFTDIDTIELHYKNYSKTGTKTYIKVGVQKTIDIIDNFDLSTTLVVGTESAVLDVSGLTGKYYFKLFFTMYGTESTSGSSINIYFTDIIFKGSNDLKLNDRSDVESGILLADNITYAEIDMGILSMSSLFLDWYNLNAMTHQPAGSRVRFNIYDENNIILKENVVQGDILKLKNSIIKVKVILERNNIEVLSPKFYWFEIAARGSTTGLWNKIDEITLNEETLQIDINIPDGYSEIRVLVDRLRAGNNSGTLSLRINNLDTQGLYYHQRITSTSVSNSSSNYFILGEVYKNDTPSYNSVMDIRIIKYQDKIMVFVDKIYSSEVLRILGRVETPYLESINIYTNYPMQVGANFKVWGR